MKHLVFNYTAPIMSCGSGAVQERTTDDRPLKSAILGMVGAALGLIRSDPWHASADRTFGYGVIVLRAGHRFVDYQVVRTASAGRMFATRREEVEGAEHSNPTLRHYLSHSYFIVALWQQPKGPGAEMEVIQRALDEPTFEIFAGRKTCTFWLPLAPMICDVESLAEAVRTFKPRLDPALYEERKDYRAYWDDHPKSGVSAQNMLERKDALVEINSIYRARQENQGVFSF